jgi:electron transport complex protein RnfC
MILPVPGDFWGGLTLAVPGSSSADAPIMSAGLPNRLWFPVRQRNGHMAQPRVAPGDRVLRGGVLAGGSQLLDPLIHASTSGRVVGIEDALLPIAAGLTGACIVLEPDGLDEPAPPLPPLPLDGTSATDLLRRIEAAGIVGLGGAIFPTAAKLSAGAITTLILNGVECESTISCDDRLLRERAAEVLEGAERLRRAFGIEQVRVAIKADMVEAFDAIQLARNQTGFDRIAPVTVPSRYPAGGERQLIQSLTGREVPAGGRPTDIGVLCLNVATVAAIQRAATRGEPLISRIVTVSGRGIREARNLDVRLGTPLRHLIDLCGGYAEPLERLILGGPMMGYPIITDAVPVTASVNALFVAGRDQLPARSAASPCIRCGACAEVCPAGLLPQELDWQSRQGHAPKLLADGLFDCIECGCCDVVCPSSIPLVEHFQRAKQVIRRDNQARAAADHARQRYEARQARLALEQAEQARSARQKKAELVQSPSAKIQEALTKARQRRAPPAHEPAPMLTEAPDEEKH